MAQGEITPFFGKDVNGCKKSLTFQNGFFRMEIICEVKGVFL